MGKGITLTKGFNIAKLLKMGNKYPANHTFVPFHLCIDINIDLSRKAQLDVEFNM